MSLARRLQDETQAHQSRLESLPCFQALSAGTLPMKSLQGLRQVFALLHQDLERALAAASHPALSTLSAESPPPHGLLESGAPPASARNALEHQTLIGAIALGEQMRSEARHSPWALLGRSYALRQAALPDPREPAPWAQLTRSLHGLTLEPAEEEQIAHAVRETLELVRSLLDTLHPPRSLQPTTWLNPSAGSHPIPADLDELRAALRAAELTWQEFPYYEWRFSHRGRQFSWSDSAWLATLSGQPPEIVWRQISWLGKLLACRGMPRFMLERHLAVLHQELVRSNSGRQQAYAVLRQAAERLAQERRRFLDDQALQRLGEGFAARVGPDWSRQLRGAGELLAAAVADEACGIAQAVPTLAHWMSEPSRFPQPWIHAVAETLAQARQACTGR